MRQEHCRQTDNAPDHLDPLSRHTLRPRSPTPHREEENSDQRIDPVDRTSRSTEVEVVEQAHQRAEQRRRFSVSCSWPS